MADKKQTVPSPERKAAGDKKSAGDRAEPIEKQFGKGAVMKLGQNVTMQVDAISTGSLSLDLALGIGGFAPRPWWKLRAGIFGYDDAGPSLHCRGAEGRRRGGLH